MIETLFPAVPAATVIVFRETETGVPDHLMIRRGDTMSVAAGALVFPGGRQDPDDEVIAGDPKLCQNACLDKDDAACRVTAIRETIEETGVPLGLDPVPDVSLLKLWRLALASGQSFSSLLRAASVRLHLACLVPFARWCPSATLVKRRFDTRFYLARVPGDVEVEVDGVEATHHVWLPAGQVLIEADAGTYSLVFPTLCNLHRLAALGSFDRAFSHALEFPVRMITPELIELDGIKYIAIPEGIGYPVTKVPLDVIMKAANQAS